ncbi:MAG: ABC transporter ATP-binding protein [Fibrobacteria bacterium]|nr:ABC transporter ATP-binding protein [Fibrobacteria bacterium]
MVIHLHSVTKSYGQVHAVHNVSLHIPKGAFFALLGLNGAGKSSIMRMLAGLSRPDSGSVEVNGVSATSPESRVNMGYLPEHHKIPVGLTGEEYLLRHCALAGLSRRDSKKQTELLAKKVGMAAQLKKRASAYSKGMLQRIGLASAMVGTPDLLLLDEPVSGLDPLGIREFRFLLEELRSKGVTILLNSHLLSEVEKTCDTAAIMDKGQILVQDKISHILKEGETLEELFLRVLEDGHA